MSDALRKEYLEKTDEEAMGGAYAKTGYIRWLEESLLTARSRVSALEEENARLKAAAPIFLDGKIVDAVNDNFDTLLEEAPSAPKVCRCAGYVIVNSGVCCRCGLPTEKEKDEE